MKANVFFILCTLFTVTDSVKTDHDQMMHQLGLAYPETGTRQENYDKLILPRLQAACSDVRLKPNNPERPDENWVWDSGTSSVGYASGGIARSSYGLWTNYIQAWEPGGDYFTGEKFYQALPLHDLSGLNAASWESRRALIFEEVQKIYGYIPPEASKLQIDWTLTEERQTSSFRQYKLSGAIDASAYPGLKQAPLISAVLRIPASARTKVPLVIHFAANYNKNRTYDETLWDTMAPEGFGLLYFDPLPLQPDRGDALTSYLIGLLNKGQWRQPLDWGTLVAWSWGLSRLIDYFEAQDSPVDASKVALTGHSRYGKASLVAMAYDKRISIAFPSSSGAMGIAQSRRHWGEDLENCVWDSEYHWLAGNAMRYAGLDESSTDGYLPRKVKQLPVDAESLVALCAPRPLFIGCGDFGKGEAWADPYGHYLTALAASPVYELLGKQGIVMNDVMDYKGQPIPMPKINTSYLQGEIGFRRHSGGHEAGPNYAAFKDFLLKYWKTPAP